MRTTNDAATAVIAAFSVALAMAVVLPVMTVINGWVAQCAWNWAASPIFHVRHVTLLEAVAACFIAGVLKPAGLGVKEDGYTGTEKMAIGLLRYAIVLATAAVLGSIAS